MEDITESMIMEVLEAAAPGTIVIITPGVSEETEEDEDDEALDDNDLDEILKSVFMQS